jgi:hypothetical protein
MKRISLLAVVMAAAACSPDARDSSSPVEPQFGKPAANPTPTFYISNDAANGLRADGVYLEADGSSRYKPGECGVSSAFFLDKGASGDVTLSTAGSRDQRCAAYPRRVRISYELINADGSTTSEGSYNGISFLNVRKLQKTDSLGNVVSYVPIGETQSRTMAFSDENFKCGVGGIGAILFSSITQEGIVTGADSVRVTRLSADTWQVFTAPDEIDAVTGQTIHHDRAWCRGNGKVYHMPVRFTVKNPVAVTP